MAIRKTYGAGSAITSTGVTNNVWNHALAVFADTDGFMTCNTGYWEHLEHLLNAPTRIRNITFNLKE